MANQNVAWATIFYKFNISLQSKGGWILSIESISVLILAPEKTWFV